MLEPKLLDDKNPKGDFNLKLIREGDLYSQSRGSGSNGNIKYNGESILIESSPNSFIHFQSDDISIGNFYEDGKLAGVVKLSKK